MMMYDTSIMDPFSNGKCQQVGFNLTKQVWCRRKLLTYRKHEQELSPDLIHRQGGQGSKDEVPNLKAGRNEGLLRDTSDADVLQHKGKIVADDAVANPLSVEAQRDGNPQPVPIALGRPQIRPGRALLGGLLGLDGLLDLGHLKVDEWVVNVPSDVRSGQVGTRLLGSPDTDEPTGALVDKVERGCDENREKGHQARRNAPARIALHVAGAKGGPGGDDGAHIPTAVVATRSNAAVCRERVLGDQQRCSNRETLGYAHDEARNNEALVILCCGLHSGSDACGDDAQPKSDFATPAVADHGCQGEGNDGTE